METKAINEWSCALACVASLLNHTGNPISQEDIVEGYTSHFPEWRFRKGLLSQGGMLTLLELFDIRVSYILLTEDKEEFLSAFNNHIERYLASFWLSESPTYHCRRFMGLSAELSNVMDPSDGKISQKTWEEITTSKPRFLLLCS